MVCALAATCLLARAQPTGRCVISGTVVDGSSGDPVHKAIVTVTWHGTPRSWATTRTDSSGVFRFEGLPTGTFDLRATKAGLGTAAYGANSARELGGTITLGDGESRQGLKLRFVHTATITGHVLDADGDPLPFSNVTLLRPGRNLGERVLVQAGTGSTDDRGEYRILNISPGQYYLRADPNAARRNMFPGLAGEREHLREVPQFLGGARESKDATPLLIHGGENLTGLDFRIGTEPAAHLTGHITGVPDLVPPPKPDPGAVRMRGDERTIIIAVSPLEEGVMRWNSGAGAQAPEYKFDLGEMVPGRYRVEASVENDKKTYAASQVVDTRQISGELVLALAPAVDIKGHFQMEGPTGQQKNSFEVRLTNNGIRRSANVAADGSFTLLQVPPGEWQWTIDPFPRGAFLKSGHFGDKDITFARLEVASGSDAQLHIVASTRAAKIDGEVDAGSGDSKRAGILLAPLGDRHNLARFYYSVAADDSGKFRMLGIAPGKYKIFALEKMAGANFRNPEAADQLNELGEEIDLAEGASLTLHPKLIPMERAREALP